MRHAASAGYDGLNRNVNVAIPTVAARGSDYLTPADPNLLAGTANAPRRMGRPNDVLYRARLSVGCRESGEAHDSRLWILLTQLSTHAIADSPSVPLRTYTVWIPPI